MTIDKLEHLFFTTRRKYISNPQFLLDVEEKYTKKILSEVILPAFSDIERDFYESPLKLMPFWMNYPPEQRGRQPKGTSIPWLELGEKTTICNILKQLFLAFPDIQFPGLPTGGDIRFISENVFVHLDIKLTGPNDNPNEVVVPPNQVSGDGKIWSSGVKNSIVPISYQSGIKKGSHNYNFQPKLPPFYLIDDKPLLCLTLFLEVVYSVKGYGDHPIEYLELSCVPNGLLLFDTYNMGATTGLLIAGKDDKTISEDAKRIRVRLNPLVSLGDWRSTKIMRNSMTGLIDAIPRLQLQNLLSQ